MVNPPQGPNEAEVADHDSSRRPVEAAEVIRRLDRLWSDQSGPAASPFSNAIGSTVGRYVLERVIGRGAFGIVYKARDPDLKRAVAVKIPAPDVLLDTDRLARFESEVQTCARLDHPGIVPLYEADLSRAVPYMASAYCPGPNLQQWMDEGSGPCDVRAAVSTIEKVARAVQYAHENGVIHRDLKPANILLVPRDSAESSLTTLNDFQPRLTDFGLAQITHGLHESKSSMIIGTPLYMSPEQAESRSEDVGPASDVFGLGAMLYHLLTGVAPFAAGNYAAVLLRLREDTPAPLSSLRPELDTDLQTVCLKCLQRDPADRYASAQELADDLQRCLNQQPILGRPVPLLRRLQRWTQQTARIHEATLLIVVLASLRLLFGPGALIMALASQEVSVSGAEMLEIFIANVVLILPNDLWTIWSARQNLKNRSSGRLYWIGIATSVVGCVLMILISLGVAPSAQWYRRSLGARILVFGLMSMIFFAQTLAWYFADWQRAQNVRVSPHRRTAKLLLLSIPVFVAMVIPGYRSTMRHKETREFAGPTESALLDGVNDMVTVENVGFESRAPITLEAWIQPNKPHRGAVISYGPVSLTVVAAGNGNRFRVHVSQNEDQVYLLDANEVFDLDRWTHVAFTYDGSEVRLYVNGLLQSFTTSVYESADDQVHAGRTLPVPFLIADIWPGSSFLLGNLRQADRYADFQFSGRIAEVRLNRSVFYHGEFAPESTLTPSPETALLLHLRDDVDRIKDATGKYEATLQR